MVKINDCPRPGETQYGYVFFDKTARTPGPVECVNKVSTSGELIKVKLKGLCHFFTHVRDLTFDSTVAIFKVCFFKAIISYRSWDNVP